MTNFKNFTKNEIKIANRIAFRFLGGVECNRLNRNFSYDRRTRIGSLAASIVFKNQRTIEQKEEWKAKKKQRAKNKVPAMMSIFDNPIVKDYMNNRPPMISDKGLHFVNRNHWAKNGKDLKIIAIFKKYKTKK